MTHIFSAIVSKIRFTNAVYTPPTFILAIIHQSLVRLNIMRSSIRSLSTVTLNRIDISPATFQFLTCLSIGAHTPLSLQDAQRIRHFLFMSKPFHQRHSAKLFPRTLLHIRSNSTVVETAPTAADFSISFPEYTVYFSFPNIYFSFSF